MISYIRIPTVTEIQERNEAAGVDQGRPLYLFHVNFAKKNELCQYKNQDRVNEFQFRFGEKNVRQYETEFCQKENDFCLS